MAAIVRGSNGAIIFSLAQKYPCTTSVLRAVILAIRVGAKLVVFKGILDAFIESNSAMAIKEVKKDGNSSCL